jgi:Glycosyl-4,4'-diaponeurosporenoate acyltransferase
MAVAPRFVIFGALTLGWVAAIAVSARPALHAAAYAWFLNWSIQIAVTVASWVHPFSLPPRYYRPPRQPMPAAWARLSGLRLYGRVVNWLTPLAFDRRSPGEIDAAFRAAETTHAITLATVMVVAAVCLATGAVAAGLCLALWNVLFNLYPIALQRNNRARLSRLALRRRGAGGERPVPAP